MNEWTPRRSMGRRIKRQALESRGWHRNPGEVGRPGRGLVAYEATDPRVHSSACDHGQIRDIGGMPGAVSRCLDCGDLVHTAERVSLDSPQPLDDRALDALRQEWNDIQFGAP